MESASATGCVTCNDTNRPVQTYNIRLERNNGTEHDTTLALCDNCATEFIALDWGTDRKVLAPEG